jgi:hypothetical protein
MSGVGTFAVARAIWDHEFFANEPFTEREAWIWMVGAAAWKPKRVRFGNNFIDLERGQFAFSVRFLADLFQWPKTSVERYMGRLKTGTMVSVKPGRGGSVLTICNYDKYAFDTAGKWDASGTPAGHQRDTGVDTREEEVKKVIRKEEEKKERKKEGADAPLFALPDEPPTPEKLYFDRVVEVLGPKARGLGARILQAQGRNVALARALIEQASTKSNPAEWLGGALKRSQANAAYGSPPDPSDMRSCGII